MSPSSSTDVGGGGGRGDTQQQENLEFILREIVGGRGFWQWRLMIFYFPIVFSSGYPLLIHALAAYAPPHRCFVPSCDEEDDADDHTSSSIYQNWTSFALPKNYAAKVMLREGEPFDPCLKHVELDPDSDTCTHENFDHETTEPCSEYVYDLTYFPRTLATDLDLVCDLDTRRRFLGSVMMAGMMAGSAIGGRLGDRFGRKRCMFAGLCCIGPSLALAGLAKSFEVYATLQLVWCTGLPFIWVNSYACIMEFFEAKSRVYCALIQDLFYWPVHFMCLGGIGYLVRDWTHLHFVSGVICTLPILTWPLLPESVRWLAQNNRWSDAHAVLTDVARGNGRKLNCADSEKMWLILLKVGSTEQCREKLSFWHMFKPAHACKSVVLTLCWATLNVTTYTLTLSATKLAGNVHLNLFLVGLVEMPGVFLLYLCLTRAKRQDSMAALLCVLSACCLTMAFIPKRHSDWILALYLSGKCAAGTAFALIWMYTSEIYPTNLRSQALGFCSTCARMAGLVCPFVSTLAAHWKPLPMLVLGLPALLSAALSLSFLPETSGESLPQDMEEAGGMTGRRDKLVAGSKKRGAAATAI